MTFNRISEILTDAKEVHTNLRRQIDFNLQNKRHAIYLLQGGALTAVSTALELNSRGFLVPRAQQKRMIDETVDLITFFDEARENARQLRAWFAGHIVERTDGNQGNLTTEDRAIRANLSRDQIQSLDDLRQRSSRIMSLYMHPSIEAIRSNVFRRTHIFDYEHANTIQHIIPTNDFSNLYLVPGLHALLLPVRTLLLSDADFQRLRGYDREIQTSI